MKIMFGYYRTSDGEYLGDSPRIDCGDYIIAVGTIRKKICENPEASPYKHHPTINRHYKTYCDENRITIQLFEFKSFKKTREIKNQHYWAYDRNSQKEKEHKAIHRIIQTILDYRLAKIASSFNIKSSRYIYIPGYFEQLKWPLELQEH